MKPDLARAIGLFFCLCTAASAAEPAPIWKDPVTGMAFVKIEKGCFRMGADTPVPPPANTIWDAIGYRRLLTENEMPQHEVCVDAFWIGQYEVTRQEFTAASGNGTIKADQSRLPAAGVTWEAANRFARQLSERSGGKHLFRLPTEAEWEYVCLAGARPDTGASADQLARTARFGLGTPAWDDFGPNVGPVGQKEPNAFGVYDMLGNVWEWTADSYQADAYTRHALYNPLIPAPQADAPRVIRGASFRTEFQQVRCTKRSPQKPSEALDTLGFRLVRVR